LEKIMQLRSTFGKTCITKTITMIKFGYTILYVNDVSKSITFYENAFGFERKFVTPDNNYGELNTGATTLSFASKQLASSNLKNGFLESSLSEKPFAVEVGFVTDSVDEVMIKAEHAGAKIVEQPKQKPWGQTVAYLRDIDGFLIEICTPVE
jgi:lactoylglutathione lyase